VLSLQVAGSPYGLHLQARAEQEAVREQTQWQLQVSLHLLLLIYRHLLTLSC
jgi:hypothetical protein